MEKKIVGWHFASTQMRDWRALGAPGEVETFEGDVVPCESGLHASEKIMDALRYAPGTLLRRVELWGDLQEHGGDKHVGRFRRILWEADMSRALRLFARMCALDVRHLWQEPMPDVVYRFLVTGDESIRAAARDAAMAAAWAADGAAAWAAADAAARAAAWAADGAAARAAAWAAAMAAAMAAAWEKQERRLIAYANAARCGLFVESVKCGI